MIKTFILTSALAGVLTLNVTDTYDTVKHSVFSVIDVYIAAANINPYAGKDQLQVAQANLYKSAQGLQSSADFAYEYKGRN